MLFSKELNKYGSTVNVIEKDSWAFSLLGKWFKYKDLELEDDLEFKAKHPTNNFRIYCLVHYNGSKRKFLYPSVTYAKRNLYFIFLYLTFSQKKFI